MPEDDEKNKDEKGGKDGEESKDEKESKKLQDKLREEEFDKKFGESKDSGLSFWSKVKKTPGRAWKSFKDLIGEYFEYILYAGFFIFLFFLLLFIVLFFTNDSSESRKKFKNKCFGELEFGRAAEALINIKDIRAIGYHTKNGDFANQSPVPIQIDSGLETDGNIIEAYVYGNIYPYGQANTDKIRVITGYDNNNSPIIREDYRECQMTDSIVETCDTFNPKNLNCTYLESDEFRRNPLRRYHVGVPHDGKPVPLINQITYVYNFHVDDRYTVMTNLKNTNYSALKTDVILNNMKTKMYPGKTCALKNGYIYMIIDGFDEMAFLMRNLRVDLYEKDGEGSIVPSIDSDTKARRFATIPFTWPTLVYDHTKSLYQDNYDDTMSFIGMRNVNNDDAKIVEFYDMRDSNRNYLNNITKKSKRTNSDEDGLASEHQYLPPGKKIYFTFSDRFYDDNDGDVLIRFYRGARHTGHKEKGIFAVVWETILGDIYGIDVTNGTIIKDGIVVQIRNAFTQSVAVHALAYVLVVWFLCWYGFGFYSGSQVLTTKQLIERVIGISFAVWTIQPDNYELFDDFIVPMFLKTSASFGTFIVDGILTSNGFSYGMIDPAMPFAVFDNVMQDILGEVMIAKLLGIWGMGGIMLFMPILIILSLISIFFFFFRSISIMMLNFIAFGIYIMVFPLFALALINSDTTKKYFQKLIDKMISSVVVNIATLIVFTMMLALILNMIKALFSFKVCYKEIDWAFSFAWNIHAWVITDHLNQTKFLTNIMYLIMTLFIGFESFDIVNNIVSSIFGSGEKGFGEQIFDEGVGKIPGGGFFKSPIGSIMKAGGAISAGGAYVLGKGLGLAMRKAFGGKPKIGAKDLKSNKKNKNDRINIPSSKDASDKANAITIPKAGGESSGGKGGGNTGSEGMKEDNSGGIASQNANQISIPGSNFKNAKNQQQQSSKLSQNQDPSNQQNQLLGSGQQNNQQQNRQLLEEKKGINFGLRKKGQSKDDLALLPPSQNHMLKQESKKQMILGNPNRKKSDQQIQRDRPQNLLGERGEKPSIGQNQNDKSIGQEVNDNNIGQQKGTQQKGIGESRKQSLDPNQAQRDELKEKQEKIEKDIKKFTKQINNYQNLLEKHIGKQENPGKFIEKVEGFIKDILDLDKSGKDVGAKITQMQEECKGLNKQFIPKFLNGKLNSQNIKAIETGLNMLSPFVKQITQLEKNKENKQNQSNGIKNELKKLGENNQ